jgi:protein-tyrosine phosphatase
VSAPFVVLFVCVGNVCRSPLAEVLLRRRLHEQLGDLGRAVVVESAGVHALEGHPMDEMAARELARLGYVNDAFRARRLTPQMALDADLVLTATKDLRSRVLEEEPAALRRAFTIREFAALVDGVRAASPTDLVADAARRRSSAEVADYDIPDPIGAGAEVHRDVADLVDGAVTPIAQAVAAAAQGRSESHRTS